MQKVYIKTDFIKLQQALKLARAVDQGSDAKMLIQNGEVKLNGEICTMRGKKLVSGDIVEYGNIIFEVAQKEE